MKDNKTLLKNGIILILFILIISILISSYLKLDNPVFLKSYMERHFLTMYEDHYLGAEFTIRYITNADDTSVVNYIEFEEYPDLNVKASEYNRSGFQFLNQYHEIPGQAVGRYSIREIYLIIDAINIENQDEDIHLTKGKVYFSDGDIKEVDIGQVILYSDFKTTMGDHFEHSMTSSSSDGSSTSQKRLKEDIELIKMEGKIFDQCKDLIEIKVGNKDYKDIAGDEYMTGNYLRIDSIFEIPEDSELRMYNYDLRPKLFYKDNEGNIFSYRLFNLDYRKHSFEFLEIIRFLRVRGEL